MSETPSVPAPPEGEPETLDLKGEAAASPSEPRVVPGMLIARRFRVVALLGRGGMGEVYEADDVELDRRVALKTIRPALLADDDALRRFRQEVALATRITHPGICRVYDIGQHVEGGRAFA